MYVGLQWHKNCSLHRHSQESRGSYENTLHLGSILFVEAKMMSLIAGFQLLVDENTADGRGSVGEPSRLTQDGHR